MKKVFLKLMILFSLILFPGCVSEKVQLQRDIQQLLPPIPSSFKHADSIRLINNWTTGIRLYKANCARCHGIFGKGRDSIPDFSKVQYDMYKTAFLAQDSTNHAVMSKMTVEDLNNVFLFLIDLKR